MPNFFSALPDWDQTGKSEITERRLVSHQSIGQWHHKDKAGQSEHRELQHGTSKEGKECLVNEMFNQREKGKCRKQITFH